MHFNSENKLSSSIVFYDFVGLRRMASLWGSGLLPNPSGWAVAICPATMLCKLLGNKERAPTVSL